MLKKKVHVTQVCDIYRVPVSSVALGCNKGSKTTVWADTQHTPAVVAFPLP